MGVFEMTNHTTKPTFEPVLSNGFTSPYNTYIWQMCKFNDRLYIGTFQNSFVGLRFGMFSLYSSADGRNWDIETDNAFGPSNSKLYVLFSFFLKLANIFRTEFTDYLFPK